ncbi:MAG: endonuclease/exonuclease/phosphatase family protein [Devosia sp.]|nr:endonuclease/exonuclease/phosphatase family protein [Devosia sp.]
MLRHIVLPLSLLLGTALPAGAMELKVMSFNIWYGGEQVSLDIVAEAIVAADADIVGVQETDGNLARLSAMTGLAYYDVRRNILSRFPIFDPKLGERTAEGAGPYSMPPLDPDAVHALVMVAPGKVVAVANTHLTSNPYGPETIREGGDLAAALQVEAETRMPEAQLLADGLKPVIATGMPVFLTGDFNSPSHLDWTEAAVGKLAQVKFAVDWPVSRLLADIGLSDSYRVVNPDALAIPGLTWTAGSPAPVVKDGETLDRIDWVLSANATPTASTVVGEVGGPDVGVGVSPWPSDHRAVVSSFEVEPADAPAMIAVEPVRVSTDGEFRIRAHMPGWGNWTGMVVPRGGAVDEAIIGIADVPLYDRPTIKLAGRMLTPGAYDAVLTTPEGEERARTQFTVVAAGAMPTLTIGKASYGVGEPVTVNWTAAQGERFEWLGVYAKGEPNVYNYWGYTYTAGRVQGSTVIGPELFGEPLPAGEYEIRLMRDDHYVSVAEVSFTVAD